MTHAYIDPSHDSEFARALGRIASGVFVVTTQSQSKRFGLLSTWIGQASFSPPMVTVAVNRERPILSVLLPGSEFTINVLAKGNQDIFKAFARPQVEDEDRFKGLHILDDAPGGAIFNDVVSAIQCSVRTTLDAGDHVIVIAAVTGGRTVDIDAEPMVHLRSSGLRY